LSDQSAAAHAGWNAGDISISLLGGMPRADRVVASNVGGQSIGDALREAVRQTWGIEAELLHSTSQAGGVRNAYPEPAKLGVDRLMAMIGAHAMHAEPVCIASVGTAMTVDAVDSNGQHLGGVIVPGPDLMVSSLLRNTSEIATRAEQGDIRDGVFADNTLGAVRQGAVSALAALIERSVESMQSQLGQTPVLLLTGGASGQLEGLLRVPHLTVPDLVLQGLAVVAAGS
jgi:type III pantothenate kinase